MLKLLIDGTEGMDCVLIDNHGDTVDIEVRQNSNGSIITQMVNVDLDDLEGAVAALQYHKNGDR